MALCRGRSDKSSESGTYSGCTGWAPKLWRQFDAEKVRQHFRVMSGMGVNCARVFLTAGSFQPTAEKIEEQARWISEEIEASRSLAVGLINKCAKHI